MPTDQPETLKLRIEHIEIRGLFDRFDYNIDLSGPENSLKLLTAPNGYGKSTILNIIKNFASGDYFYFLREKFRTIHIHLSDHTVVELRHVNEATPQVQIQRGTDQTVIRFPAGTNEGNDTSSLIFERVLPFLTRIGPRKWRHDRTGEILEGAELYARYGSHSAIRSRFKRDKWLERLRRSLSVFSISTNRLKLDDDLDPFGRTTGQLMVAAIATEIEEKIQSAIRRQFEVGRRKETSFPTRLIESLQSGITPARESVTNAIKSVQEYEERYGRLGLVPKTGTTQQLSYHAVSSETAGMLVLKTYLEDVLEKFALLDELAKQLDVFCSSLNNLLAFKTIVTSADGGIVARVRGGNRSPLPLSALSSGEQHLIVLLGKLVFDTTPESLVLIDEPEISFHPEWQEKFLSILEEVRELNGFSTLIATHSPILIGDRWDNVIELAEQYQASDRSTPPEVAL